MFEIVRPTPAQSALVAHWYGAGAINVVPLSRPLGTLPAADRLHDSPPWNGGDFITSRYEGTCTSGPPAYRQSDGKQFLISAGHCAPASRIMYNQRDYPEWPPVGNLVQVGRVAYNDQPTNDGLDAELIWTDNYGGSSSLDWRGYNVSAAQQSWADPQENTSVCVSGAYEGEVCGTTVTAVDGCYQFLDPDNVLRYHCHISRLVDYNVNYPAGQGDSGGPVYQVDPNTLKLNVRGIIEGIQLDPGAGQFPTCRVLSTQAHPRLCSHVVLITDIVPILQHWGLALKRS